MTINCCVDFFAVENDEAIGANIVSLGEFFDIAIREINPAKEGSTAKYEILRIFHLLEY